ncbi:hypothetical protein OH686_04140 [Pseudomonas sp. SO81]|nr:hypothetical protein OH686_04140 [Pseudomonas sp. SO81]
MAVIGLHYSCASVRNNTNQSNSAGFVISRNIEPAGSHIRTPKELKSFGS